VIMGLEFGEILRAYGPQDRRGPRQGGPARGGPAKRGGGLGGVANATSRIPTAEDEEIGDFIRLQPTRIRQTGPR